MDKSIAAKLTQTIAQYEQIYAEEFAAYKKQKQFVGSALRNEFAATQGTHVLERELFSLPESLFAMIKLALTQQEYEHVWARDPHCEGAKWFAKTFPQYRTGTRL